MRLKALVPRGFPEPLIAAIEAMGPHVRRQVVEDILGLEHPSGSEYYHQEPDRVIPDPENIPGVVVALTGVSVTPKRSPADFEAAKTKLEELYTAALESAMEAANLRTMFNLRVVVQTDRSPSYDGTKSCLIETDGAGIEFPRPPKRL